MTRIFVLSPAHCGGQRARLLFNERAAFPLALRLRVAPGVPLGEVFAFLSGLYFRGKLAYARTFARPPRGVPGVLVITPGRGLLPAEQPVTVRDLRAFSRVPVDPEDARYRRPLVRHARLLAESYGDECDAVLLGSVATRKYVDILGAALGHRLKFPSSFAGRGDMSRGGLLLRAVAGRRELEYVPVGGLEHHGPRPPRLPPLPRHAEWDEPAPARSRRNRPSRAPRG